MKKQVIDDEVNKFNIFNYQQRSIENKELAYLLKQRIKSGSRKQKELYEQGVLCVYDCLSIMGE